MKRYRHNEIAKQYRAVLWALAGVAMGMSVGAALQLPARQSVFAAVFCAGVLAIVRLNVRVQPVRKQQLLPQPQPVQRLSATSSVPDSPKAEQSLLADDGVVYAPDEAREVLAKFLDEHQG